MRLRWIKRLGTGSDDTWHACNAVALSPPTAQMSWHMTTFCGVKLADKWTMTAEPPDVEDDSVCEVCLAHFTASSFRQ